MIGGHGHVIPRADGLKARCGGPALCGPCALEAGLLEMRRKQIEGPSEAQSKPQAPHTAKPSSA